MPPPYSYSIDPYYHYICRPTFSEHPQFEHYGDIPDRHRDHLHRPLSDLALGQDRLLRPSRGGSNRHRNFAGARHFGKSLPGLLRLRFYRAGPPIAERHRLVGSDDFRVDRWHRTGPEEGLGASPGECHHSRARPCHAAAVGQHRGRGHVDARRLDRSQGEDLAIRPRSRHGLCRHRASHPDSAHGEAADPPASHRAAHPALCEPG